MTELTAGAPVLHPGRVAGVGPTHLGRTEARKHADPALLAVCNRALDLELDRVPARPWWRRWRRLRWCPECAAYRDYLRRLGST